MKKLLFVLLTFIALAGSNLLAQSQLGFLPDDSVKSLLQRHVGKAIELRMRSGEKIGGKLERVGDKLIHLSQLTGAEFYEAAVEIDGVTAIVIRTKSN